MRHLVKPGGSQAAQIELRMCSTLTCRTIRGWEMQMRGSGQSKASAHINVKQFPVREQ